MHPISTKKICVCLVTLLFLTCVSCKAGTFFLVGDYLNALANKSGIGLSEDIDDNFEKLALWDIVDEEDKSLLDKALDYDFLSKTICKLLAESGDPLTVLRQKGYLSYSDRAKAKVKEEKALAVIDKAVKQLNEPQFEPFFEEEQKQEFHPINEDLAAGDLIYKDDACQIVTKADGEDLSYRPADYEEVFEKLNIETSDYVDFNQAVIVPYGEVLENTSYINEKYELLASNDPHVFTSNGFRVSYSLNTSGIDFHISKNEEGLNAYLDISIHNVKPRLKWLEERNDLKNCFFTLDFNTTEKLGISCGRYKNYRMKFKDLDAKSFKSLLNSLFVPVKEDDEVSIPLCKIKVPIAQIPTAFLNMDLKVKLHASGKSEFVLYNAHKLGFETKGGKIRYINKNDHDLNAIMQASAKAVLGLNMGVETLGFTLADVEVDGGLRGVVRSTLHLFDEDGQLSSSAIELPYSGLEELSEENEDVKVCGDVSLHYLLDLILNTSKSRMNKLGFTQSFSILDEEDQVFGGLHHIENGHFVEKCTRKNRPKIKDLDIKSDRIVLDSYAEVLKIGQTYRVKVKALPEGYREEDLIYTSPKEEIAKTQKGEIIAIAPGSVRIEIKTPDEKHKAYVNILVSTDEVSDH